jgi:hypothetical protein
MIKIPGNQKFKVSFFEHFLQCGFVIKEFVLKKLKVSYLLCIASVWFCNSVGL